MNEVQWMGALVAPILFGLPRLATGKLQGGMRGPAPKLQQQLERINALPKAK